MAEAVIMPKTGMAMEEGVIIEWLKKEGDAVSLGEVIAQIETDKSTMDLESDVAGTLLKLVYPAGTTVPVTVPIAWIGTPGEKIPEEAPPVEQEVQQEKPVQAEIEPTLVSSSTGKIAATPAARRVAAEKGIDLASVQASGKHGEVREQDVHAIKATPLAKRIAADTGVDLSQVPGSGHAGKIYSRDIPMATSGEDKRVPLTNIQKITGKRMLESVQSIPMVTENIAVDVTELLELKQSVREQSGVQASVNDFVITAVARALQIHPRMNSVFDTDALIYRHEINIGVAVATERGLLVPVLKHANTYNLSKLTENTRALIQRARSGKLGPDELSGSTFSISNVGMFGITSFSPIINPPEAGILGVCAIEQLPRFKDGVLVERSIMTLSLTFDHRIVDGAESAQFLQTVKDLLEKPLQLLV
jgi:pyruvate dehydrogenase E2 component (dihydrolipoamide acetyltransferase)